MLLRHSLNLPREAEMVERAVDRPLREGCRTVGIDQSGERALSTRQMADEIIARVGKCRASIQRTADG